MKKVIMLVAVLALLGTTACKKCKDCTTTIKQAGITTGTVDVGELCGDDLKEVDGKTINQEVNVGGILISQSVTYNCN